MNYDEQTVAVMSRHLTSTSNCIDVGAHTGDILQEMLRLAPHGWHFAFEPLPGIYRQLVARFGHLSNVALHNIALGNTAGTVPFQHVVGNPGYSGFRRRRYDRPDEPVEEISVRTAPLDSIIPSHLPIHFVKIDVEGAELQVLEGATQVVRRSRPLIVFEHGLGAADCYGTTPEDIFRLLSDECSLRISLMAGWLAGKAPLSEAEFSHRFHAGMDYYFLAHP